MENCNRQGTSKPKCGLKAESRGQYPKDLGGNNTRTSMPSTQSRTPNSMGLWIHKQNRSLVCQFVATIHVSPIEKTFPLTRSMTRIMRIHLTRVMHVPKAEGKILSLKVLAQKGFESRILSDRIKSLNTNRTYTEALLVESYTNENEVIPPQEKHPFSCQER